MATSAAVSSASASAAVSSASASAGQPGIGARGPFALRGLLLRGPGAPVDGAVVIDGGKVVTIDSPADPARLPSRCLEAPFIAPGFVDLQVNGGFGFEVGADGGALAGLARQLPRTGVTTFLPTLISAPSQEYAAVFAAVRAVIRAGIRAAVDGGGPPRDFGAHIAGLHLEGPLLATARAGAHDPAFIDAASAAALEGLVDPTLVRLVTLAPERTGALPLIRLLRARGVTVALGHTDASFAAFTAGIDAGATLATHLFNAMSMFHHRDPGAVGAVLTDDRIAALMIADGVHSHPAAFRLAARAKGLERIGLVTDAIAGAGMPPGPFALGGRAVIVDETSARLPAVGGGVGTLAGSTLTMDQAVRNAAAFAGLSAAAAVYIASEVPARAAGLAAAGRLAVGAPADIVLLGEDLTVLGTFVDGELAYCSPERDAQARALWA